MSSLLPATAAAVLLLSSCASLSEKECRNADWRMIGYEDGAAGRPATRLAEHREACADYAITPALEDYRLGREEGLREYCRADNAYQLGRSGNAYPVVCPDAVEGELRPAYQAGQRVYRAQTDVRNLEHALAQKRKERDQLQQELLGCKKEVAHPATTRERRVELVTEAWRLARRQQTVEDEIGALESDLAMHRARLESLESSRRP